MDKQPNSPRRQRPHSPQRGKRIARLTSRRSRIVTIGLLVAGVVAVALLLHSLITPIIPTPIPKIPPSKPTSIKGAPGNRSASLSWSASTHATDYLIEQTDLASAQVQRLPHRVTGTSSRVTGLATGHWYRFRVIPVNDTIEGTPSDPIVIRTTGFQGSYDHYYVLGDSYSSGEGAPPYSGNMECYQSDQGYPYQLGSGVPTPVMFACSGATTDDIDTTIQHPDLSGTQLQLLQNSPTANSLITLTIGGNDIGFAQELENCIFNVTTCTDRQVAISQKIAALGPRLVQVYHEIRRAAPAADIIVLGYPLLVALPDTASCSNPLVNFGLGADKMTMIRQLAVQLDTTITQAANEAGITSAASQVESAFAGHEACTPNQTNEWINELSGLTRLGHGSFHPNASGYLADAQAVNARRTALYQTGMVLSLKQVSA